MKNIPLLVGTILGTLLLVVGVAFFFSNSQTAPEGETQIVDQSVLLQDARHSYGPEDAAVTIVEFSDFSCPSCRATQPLLKQVANAYPEDVRLVYRQFPLGSFPNTQLAAQASEYIGEQGLFWEFNDMLYERQQEWSQIRSEAEFQEVLVSYAEELGIDTTDFIEKIQDTKYRDLVYADRSLGNSLNVSGTPTLFVNGQRLSAPNQLPSLIEAMLAADSSTSQEEMEETEEVSTQDLEVETIEDAEIEVTESEDSN
jgi:protein-disulfide isomerase